MSYLKSFVLHIIVFSIISISSLSGQNIFKHLDVLQCDSLIAAEATNPLFVILDVRTPEEYTPEHLEHAIMRNYYDSDFSNQLDQLNKDKIYLIHCRSGARSGNTLNIMEEHGFKTVYNMLGGINAWKSNGLSVTGEFSSRLSLISTSDNIINQSEDMNDTVQVTITNNGNEKLDQLNLENNHSPLFESNFIENHELDGGEDYTFEVYYTTLNSFIDSFPFRVDNGLLNLDFNIHVYATTSSEFLELDRLKAYPNPTSGMLYFNHSFSGYKTQIIDINGKTIDKFNASIKSIDISDYPVGNYIFLMTKGKNIFKQTIVKY